MKRTYISDRAWGPKIIPHTQVDLRKWLPLWTGGATPKTGSRESSTRPRSIKPLMMSITAVAYPSRWAAWSLQFSRKSSNCKLPFMKLQTPQQVPALPGEWLMASTANAS